MKLYWMTGSGRRGEGVGDVPDSYEKVSVNEISGEINNWNIPEFTLEQGGFTDFQKETLGYLLISAKLRDVIDSAKSEHDVLQWLDAKVSYRGETRDYYVLHFPSQDEAVIDREHSTFNRLGIWMKQCISKAGCEKYNIFIFPGSSLSLFVKESVKKAIEAARCTGIVFEKKNVY